MGLLGWIIGGTIALAALSPSDNTEDAEKERARKEAEKANQEWLAQLERKRREEERRVNTPCHFNNGISEREFKQIVLRSIGRIKRITDVDINGPIISATVRSQSGISDWTFQLDYNDYGQLTGKYWTHSRNTDSEIPKRIAEWISEEIKDKTNPKTSSFESNLKDETEHTKPKFPIESVSYKVCHSCGKQVSIDSVFCTYCGSKFH